MLVYTLAAKFLLLNSCYFTNIKLWYLHCHNGHPSMYYLYQFWEQSRYTLQYLQKYYKYYQKYNLSFGYFTFTLKKNLDFNYNIIIDIIYIEKRPILHLVDKTTQFQARCLLKNVLA